MFVKQALNFENQLYNLINNCGLTIDEAYYIVSKASLELKISMLETIRREDQEEDEKETQTSVKVDPVIEYENPVEEKKETEENE